MCIRDRKESSLIDCVRDSLKASIGNIASLEALLTGIDQTSINQALAKEYSCLLYTSRCV